MPAPTVTYLGASAFSDATGTETITGVTFATGDVIVVLGETEDQGALFSGVPALTGAGTFAAMTGLPTATASSCKGYGWSVTCTGSGSGNITIGGTGGGGGRGIAAYKIAAGTSTGLGTPVVLTNTALVASLTRTGANSVVLGILGDWNATTDLVVDSSPAGGTVRVASGRSGGFTAFVVDWPDQGAAGTTNYGITNATGTGTVTKVTVEVFGTGGGPSGSASSSTGAKSTASGQRRATRAATSSSGAASAASGRRRATGAATSAGGAISAASGLRRARGTAASTTGARSSASGVANVPEWENIPGATAAVYTLTGDDISGDVHCVVTVTNIVGSDEATSNEIGPVLAEDGSGSAVSSTGAQSTASGRRRSTGSAQSHTGARSTASGSAGAGSWVPISGATAPTYTQQPDDETADIRCMVTATNLIGPTQAPSNVLGPVEPAAEASGSATSTTGARSSAAGVRRSVSSSEVLGPVPPFTEQVPGARSTTGAKSTASGSPNSNARSGSAQSSTGAKSTASGRRGGRGTASSHTGSRSASVGVRRARGICASHTGAASRATGRNPALFVPPRIDLPTFITLDPQTTAILIDPRPVTTVTLGDQLTAVALDPRPASTTTLDPQTTEVVLDG